MADKRRITKVTTRAGDSGRTKLATGRSIDKTSANVRVIGSVDELNSHIGVLTSLIDPQHLANLNTVQQALFDIGAVLAMEGQYSAPDAEVLEQITDTLNAALPPLTEFVIPGGGPAAAQSHVCRSVCRRAETDLWTLLENTAHPTPDYVGAAQYLNRLSDYFFVLARSVTTNPEVQWRGPTQESPSADV